MPDVVSSAHRTSWFSRIKNALAGVVIGVILIPVAVYFLGWNEYRTIHRTQGLKQGASAVVSIDDPDTLRPELDQSLVHLSAWADTQETLEDQEFKIAANVLKMRRKVEMFQWVEETSTDSKTNLGGSEETETTYSYEQKWAQGRVDSSGFHLKTGHANPQDRFKESQEVASLVNVGAYKLNDGLKSQIQAFRVLDLSDELLESLPAEIKEASVVEGNYLYWSANVMLGGSTIPQLGDQRIQFEVIDPLDVSIVAQQTGDTFAAFKVPNGEAIHNLKAGKLTAVEMFEALQADNMTLAWLIRGGGLAACCMGFFLILSPLAVLTDIVPIFGSLTRSLLGMVAMLAGVAVSAITIAVSWIAVRPLLGIALLVVAVVAIGLLIRLLMKRKSRQSSQSGEMQAS